MVKENNDYIFSYQTERYQILDVNRLTTLDKLVLLKSIIRINDYNEDWLIKAENYLLEPELIYTINNKVTDGNIRLLFYPDFNRATFKKKIVLFSDKIKNRKNKNECDIIEGFKTICENNDWNRTLLYLDKHILRMNNNGEYKAS